MPLNTALELLLNVDQSLDSGLSAGSVPVHLTERRTLTNGTGANQADLVYHARRTLVASATEDLDLAGVLVGTFPGALAFVRIKLIYVVASSANTNNVILGGASSNAFVNWVGAATHTVTVRPGGLLVLAAPDATAYAVTAATGDLLHVANSAGSTSVTYDIVLIGASA